MTAVEKLKEVEAELRLTELGYEKVKCGSCGGIGFAPGFGHFMPKCSQCKGDGQVWLKKESEPHGPKL